MQSRKYKIKMMNGDQFIISLETFKALDGKSGLVWLEEIDAMINLSSVCTITYDDQATIKAVMDAPVDQDILAELERRELTDGDNKKLV